MTNLYNFLLKELKYPCKKHIFILIYKGSVSVAETHLFLEFSP